jgi:predicted N-acyltransferase
VAQAWPEPFVLMLGGRSDAGVARTVTCALGVYRGGTEWRSGLYLETCCHQSIEYCIAHCIDELNEDAPFRSTCAPGDGVG